MRGTRRIVDPTLVNRAILSGRNGAAKHPWLSALLPPRPEDARVCWVCTGTGLPVPGVVCSCGGAGWVPAWDDYVKSGGG